MTQSTSPSASTTSARRGFTLVELLVVIGIIALLISMLLPALQKARFSAKVTACGSNQRQIYIAMVMYANDNNGFLPGTRSWNGDTNHGAVYGTEGGDYPWEPKGAGTIAPLNKEKRFFGIGQLVAGRYLPPNRVITCPDFTTAKSNNSLANDRFDLDSRFADLMNGTYSYIEGSYVLNTIPYYDMSGNDAKSSNKSRGKIGKPGRDGGRWSPGPFVPHHRAYLMCLSAVGTQGAGHQISPTITHERKGVNVTYIDGHVVYQPISPETWATYMWYGTFVSTGGDCNGMRGFWPWATQVE